MRYVCLGSAIAFLILLALSADVKGSAPETVDEGRTEEYVSPVLTHCRDWFIGPEITSEGNLLWVWFPGCMALLAEEKVNIFLLEMEWIDEENCEQEGSLLYCYGNGRVKKTEPRE